MSEEEKNKLKVQIIKDINRALLELNQHYPGSVICWNEEIEIYSDEELGF